LLFARFSHYHSKEIHHETRAEDDPPHPLILILSIVLPLHVYAQKQPRTIQRKPVVGTVTRVVAVINPKNYTGRCPAHLKFSGTIFVKNPPVAVEYQWVRSDGVKGGVQRAVIRSAGQGFDDTWDLGEGKMRLHVWERLHVLAPRNVASNAARASRELPMIPLSRY
jgi:hypothetical protein